VARVTETTNTSYGELAATNPNAEKKIQEVYSTQYGNKSESSLAMHTVTLLLESKKKNGKGIPVTGCVGP
jgi:hypothetical protein